MMVIFWMNRVNPRIGPVIEFQTRPFKNFLISSTNIDHSRWIWRQNVKNLPDVLRQLAKHFLTLLQGVLCPSALRDVDESYYCTNQDVLLTYWIGPILNREARFVRTPDNFVVHVATLASAKS